MIINVAIALIGIYTLFALISSHIVEQIAALLNRRGQTLYDGIVQLAGDALANYMYAHPLIKTLETPKGAKPAYVPTRTFSLAFLDGFRALFAQDANKVAIQMPPLLATPQQLFADIVSRVDGLPAGPLKQTLTIAVQQGNQYDDLLAALDAWFESGMQRVSGWYKRWSSAIILIVSALLVFIFNADTIAIVRSLVSDQTVAAAAANATQQLTSSTSLVTAFNSLVNANAALTWQSGDLWGPGAIWNNFGWLPKLAGLALTFAATALGAPFWFNLLQAIVPVRLTGDKPAATTAAAATPGDIRDVQSATKS